MGSHKWINGTSGCIRPNPRHLEYMVHIFLLHRLKGTMCVHNNSPLMHEAFLWWWKRVTKASHELKLPNDWLFGIYLFWWWLIDVFKGLHQKSLMLLKIRLQMCMDQGSRTIPSLLTELLTNPWTSLSDICHGSYIGTYINYFCVSYKLAILKKNLLKWSKFNCL